MTKLGDIRWDTEKGYQEKEPVSLDDKRVITEYYHAGLKMGKPADKLLEELSRRYDRSPRQIQRYIAEVRAQESIAQPTESITKFLKEWAKNIAGPAREIESRALSLLGQGLATQLDTLTPRVLSSFGCYDIGLKALRDMLSVGLGQRFDAWLEQPLKDVESSLERRRIIWQQILTDARGGCKSLGSVELVDNNFALAAYHFLARGDGTWLKDDHFQVLELGPPGQMRLLLKCPLGDHNLYLQEWDTREFICPSHDVPLVQKEGAISSPLIEVVHASGIQMNLYQESVVPVEDIAMKYPSKVALSVRIHRMLPFSELVIAVGETDSMPRLRRFVQNFLQASSLREEVRRNEGRLERSYVDLLEASRSTPATDAGQPDGGVRLASAEDGESASRLNESRPL